MAYTRDEKEKLEIDYPIEDIWTAIPLAVDTLGWTIQEKNDQTHKLKLKTKAGFLSYGTTFNVELESVDKKKSRMSSTAETPVTTITAMADFGRTSDRVEAFVVTLARQMEKKK
jgi:hypothetical protein